MTVLANYEPKRVLAHFESLTRIPRCSKNEREVSDFIKRFGLSLGLETIQDESLNVIIKKPASPGYEDHPTVILQGHMDMVCEKTEQCSIDFAKDPIRIAVKDGYIVAEGTTLGADNGVAVAMMMAVLEDNTMKHPPIEALFTSDEEMGMTGAKAVDFSQLDGEILLNLDTEEEGVAIVGCAGGERIHLHIPFEREQEHSYNQGYSITVSGLTGGHSGAEIHLGRANANILMARLLKELNGKISYGIVSMIGGAMDNAIPRLAVVEIACDKKDGEVIEALIKKRQESFAFEHGVTDPDLILSVKSLEVKAPIDKKAKEALIDAILLIPNGVQAMNQQLPVVESSNNVGVVKTAENEVIITSALRSANVDLLSFTAERILAIAHLLGAKAERTGGYPAWPYKPETKIEQVLKDTYYELTGHQMEIQVIHAGLECGIFAEKDPDMEMISFGPDIRGAHSPEERMSIASTEHIWKLLIKTLENL